MISPFLRIAYSNMLLLSIAPLFSLQRIDAAQEKREQKVEIVIISSHNCTYCRKLAAQFDQLKERAGKIAVRIEYADTPSAQRALEAQFAIRIQGLPTTLVIIGGVAHSFAGYRDADHWWNEVRKRLPA